MKKTRTQKPSTQRTLVLARETVRALSDRTLLTVAGGGRWGSEPPCSLNHDVRPRAIRKA